ncbi:MAG TPA: cytochrome c3 family protein [Acidobacteriota bacterium]|nr:cytochrome c3 family protein [Acidobacteriota bacterium]
MVACICIVSACITGCGTTTRYKVLNFFFDGVPNPSAPKVVPQRPGAAPVAAAQVAVFTNHGPYAAKLCEACHQRQTNALVLPKDELCYKCHELRLDKKYVHGPLASGGCLVCHDPHSSPYRYLLVSESSSFCVRCHDAGDVSRNPAHQGAAEQQCTDCHDAHMSDKQYLLR